jgi:hypothetical protein
VDYIPAALQMEVLAGPTTPSFLPERGAGVWLNCSWAWDFEGSLVNSQNGGEMPSAVVTARCDP